MVFTGISRRPTGPGEKPAGSGLTDSSKGGYWPLPPPRLLLRGQGIMMVFTTRLSAPLTLHTAS